MSLLKWKNFQLKMFIVCLKCPNFFRLVMPINKSCWPQKVAFLKPHSFRQFLNQYVECSSRFDVLHEYYSLKILLLKPWSDQTDIFVSSENIKLSVIVQLRYIHCTSINFSVLNIELKQIDHSINKLSY
jgi:hypothetical protein